MKINERLKKLLNIYNLAVVGCIIVIIVSLVILLKPDKKLTPGGVEVVQTKVKENEDITEELAKKVAIKQFKKLGEKRLKEDKLEVMKIERSNEKYYYITSPQNTLEIKIKGGNITRINSATVEE